MKWVKEKKMLLNTEKGKTEVTFFAAGSVDAKWIPKIILYDKEMEFNANPKFLGVTMDRTLSFQQHVDAVVKTVEARCKAIAVLGASDFGWKTEQLRKVFLATQKSVMDYAGPGWQPWLSSTQMDRLDRAHNKALRRVTGHACSTPIEAVRLEANVQSYQTTSRRLAAIS